MGTTNRECRKCGDRMPLWIEVDGKRKNLQNRKFCLVCSPWGKHNTSPNDPTKRVDRKTSAKHRETVTLSLYKRALQRKADLIQRSGGGCKACGYSKDTRALSFHHLDRETKLFGLSLNQLWSKSWEEILAEWGKCSLLCLNCHAEVEGERGTIVDRVNAKYGTSF